MKRTLALVAVLGLTVIAMSSAVVKPKPWQWTPAQAKAAIMAQGSEVAVGPAGPQRVVGLTCRGLGKRVAGRFVSFQCALDLDGGASPDLDTLVWAKTRKTGGLCWSTDSLARVPSGCLAPGKRARGNASDAYRAFRLAIKVSPVDSGCVANGAGFYSCFWTVGLNGVEEHRAAVVFGPTPVVKILS